MSKRYITFFGQLSVNNISFQCDIEKTKLSVFPFPFQQNGFSIEGKCNARVNLFL